MGENETPTRTGCGAGNPGATHWYGCACHEAEWKRKLDEAEAENAEVHLRFARLLDRLTDGRMSKTNYSVEVMEQEIDAAYERWHEQDRKDALLAEEPGAAKAAPWPTGWGHGETEPDEPATPPPPADAATEESR